MAFNILKLLGLQNDPIEGVTPGYQDTRYNTPELPPVAVGQPLHTVDTNTIDVNGMNEPVMQAAQRPLANIPTIDRVDIPAADIREMIPRQGMFGLKGTLRDVIGLIGDSLLIGSGNQPIYAPRRRQERMGDAMYGITDESNPEAFRAGIERLAAAGFPEQAAEMYSKYQVNQQRREASNALAENRKMTQIANARKYAAQTLYAADTPQKRAFAETALKRLADGLGIEVEDLVLGDVAALDREAFGMSSVPVAQQIGADQRERRMATQERQGDRRLDQGDARIGISSRNADTSAARAAETARANRVRESRANTPKTPKATTPTKKPKAMPGWGAPRRVD